MKVLECMGKLAKLDSCSLVHYESREIGLKKLMVCFFFIQ